MSTNHDAVLEEVRAEARAREGSNEFPASLADKARTATAWMGAGDSAGGDDVRFAASLLSRQASRNLEAPAVTGTGVRRLMKRAVVALVGWYGRFLGQHLGAVGQAFARLGVAVADRVEGLEAAQARDREAMWAELEALRARVAALEAALASDEQAVNARP